MIDTLSRLDRYLLRTLVGSFGAGLVFMVLLFSSIDLLLNVGTYLEAAAARGLGLVALSVDLLAYYALFLPVVFVMIAPFVSVIAGMFAISSHMTANEIVPMLFTGRSMARVLRPVLGMGLVSAVLMAVCWEWVIPSITEPLYVARRSLEGESGAQEIEGLVVKLRDGTNQTLYVRRYDHSIDRMTGVTVIDRSGGPGDVVVTTALRATWDPARHDWRLSGGERRSERQSAPQEMLGLSDVEPELLWRLGKEDRETLQLSYTELLDLQSLRPGRKDYTLAFHSHITAPLANLVLLLLALPFAVHFERGSRIGRVVFAVTICGAYLVIDLICENLGRSMLHPILAAWLPTIVFGAVGVVSFSGVRT